MNNDCFDSLIINDILILIVCRWRWCIVVVWGWGGGVFGDNGVGGDG